MKQSRITNCMYNHADLAFKLAVENICSVGRHLCKDFADPRRLFKFEHDRTMRALLRHHGQGNTFVPALDMYEARNGPYFIDRKGLVGVCTGGIYTLGVLSGRRARTIVEMRLRDLKFVAEAVQVDGRSVMVPSARAQFVDEKFSDVLGHSLIFLLRSL